MDAIFHPGPAPLLAAGAAYLRHERFSASVLAVSAGGEAVGDVGTLWVTVEDGNGSGAQ